MEVLAEGWWCTKCEVFEDDDHTDTLQEVCTSCGCYGADHRRVEVTTKGLS